jgi:hypothetical protein
MGEIAVIETSIQGLQHEKVLQASITGTVTRIGYYSDTMPKLMIVMKKSEATAIPYLEGVRVHLPFFVHGNAFTAGVRATSRSMTVMVCPDLLDADGGVVRLADVLLGNGWTRSKLWLKVEGGALYVDRVR